jgi:hypothetical protein
MAWPHDNPMSFYHANTFLMAVMAHVGPETPLTPEQTWGFVVEAVQDDEFEMIMTACVVLTSATQMVQSASKTTRVASVAAQVAPGEPRWSSLMAHGRNSQPQAKDQRAIARKLRRVADGIIGGGNPPVRVLLPPRHDPLDVMVAAIAMTLERLDAYATLTHDPTPAVVGELYRWVQAIRA